MVDEISEEEFKKLKDLVPPIHRMKKQDFTREFRETILDWVKKKEKEMLTTLNDKKYSWHKKSNEDSIKERDQYEQMINYSKERNNGGIDLKTVNIICRWGFCQDFPLQDPQKTLSMTREALTQVDKGNYFDAVNKLMEISGVGISRASKIIGLSNQDKLCIYDSRVGHALRDLKKDNTKLIKCPPDRRYKRDCDSTTRSGWATNYERLIWTVEIIQEYFKEKQRYLRAADIEMALFVLGK